MNLLDDLALRDAWKAAGRQVAVATVVSVQGTAPRPPGSRLLVAGDGEMVGSVSGGCVENDVVVRALEVIRTGAPVVVDYGISDEQAFDVGLACGGTIKVLIERW
ncbi:MAG TPA: XdhC family protein [Acidimicrobiia bacterium]|nr:XdhC family protein [Acidimicrobiia bacterium]